MSITVGKNSFEARQHFMFEDEEVYFYSLEATKKAGLGDFSRLPIVLRILLENLLRYENGGAEELNSIKAFEKWILAYGKCSSEIAYRPARVLMQDFTGVPAIVDLAAMRDAMVDLGGDPEKINPLNPVDLVIDHSVMIDNFGNKDAFKKNVEKEYERNLERYAFLKWGQNAFNNFRVVPPGTGICHQVNLEYLGQTVWSDSDQENKLVAYPDTLVGTDSHTTMVNGLSILGWGVGGIEAEAAMLGQPVSMLIPEVIGFKISGELPDGVTATDLVLIVVKMLRELGVVGKFVEFFGPGMDNLPLADRATIANMAPEYGATCGFFPTDEETLRYLKQSGRDEKQIRLVEQYSKINGLWRDSDYDPIYTDVIELNLEDVVPAISGPKRPQDHVPLSNAKLAFEKELIETFKRPLGKKVEVKGEKYYMSSGKIVIASITSCTNTSNPSVMIAAGLVAQKARNLGLSSKPWVKTSLAPGSQVVTDYLINSGVQGDLDYLGFNLVGYGCTTCIGNSGPLKAEISDSIHEGDLVAVSVLSGNRNFEGRISPDVRANYLASPPLVVVYALVGDITVDITTESLGKGSDGQQIYLKDIWPSAKEISDLVEQTVTREAFQRRYADVFKGDKKWQSVTTKNTKTYDWPEKSTYVRNPPYFEGMSHKKGNIKNIKEARILAILGDMVTTDHISPAGSFKESHPAGKYLQARQISEKDFNSYGSRRGNHEVMMRGTFANIRIRNEMLDGKEGGFTKNPNGEEVPIFDAAMEYDKTHTPLIIIAGKEYGAGSSRDWAAKGTMLLGVKAVIAESFERIHRSNLVGMGVIPFEFFENDRTSLELTGDEKISISDLEKDLIPLSYVHAQVQYKNGSIRNIQLRCRIDTQVELEYIEHGGVLHYVLRDLAQAS